MPNYTDGFAVAKIWIDHGALAYHEVVSDEMYLEGTRSFLNLIDARDN